MNESAPLVNGMYQLQKFPGKGGWTYAEIPEIAQNKENPFGWVTVRGSVDGYPLEHYKLQPMGNGRLFLPVKAAIRKKIKKEAGDEVHVMLFAEDRPFQIPEEIKACFEFEDPALWKTFCSEKTGEQKSWIDWIQESKTDATKVHRISIMMKSLENGIKFRKKSV